MSIVHRMDSKSNVNTTVKIERADTPGSESRVDQSENERQPSKNLDLKLEPPDDLQLDFFDNSRIKSEIPEIVVVTEPKQTKQTNVITANDEEVSSGPHPRTSSHSQQQQQTEIKFGPGQLQQMSSLDSRVGSATPTRISVASSNRRLGSAQATKKKRQNQVQKNRFGVRKARICPHVGCDFDYGTRLQHHITKSHQGKYPENFKRFRSMNTKPMKSSIIKCQKCRKNISYSNFAKHFRLVHPEVERTSDEYKNARLVGVTMKKKLQQQKPKTEFAVRKSRICPHEGCGVDYGTHLQLHITKSHQGKYPENSKRFRSMNTKPMKSSITECQKCRKNISCRNFAKHSRLAHPEVERTSNEYKNARLVGVTKKKMQQQSPKTEFGIGKSRICTLEGCDVDYGTRLQRHITKSHQARYPENFKRCRSMNTKPLKSSILGCQKCRKTISYSNFAKHFRVAHPEVERPSYEYKNARVVGVVTKKPQKQVQKNRFGVRKACICPHEGCDVDYGTRLQRHITKSHQGKYPENFKRFRSMNTKPMKSSIIECQKCKKNISYSNFAKHFRIAHSAVEKNSYEYKHARLVRVTKKKPQQQQSPKTQFGVRKSGICPHKGCDVDYGTHLRHHITKSHQGKYPEKFNRYRSMNTKPLKSSILGCQKCRKNVAYQNFALHFRRAHPEVERTSEEYKNARVVGGYSMH